MNHTSGSAYDVVTELSLESFYKTIVVGYGELRASPVEMDADTVRQKLDAGTPLDDVSAWSMKLSADQIYWVRLDEKSSYLDVAYKGGFGQTMARFLFSDAQARDRLFAAMEDKLSERFVSSRLVYGPLRAMWVQLLGAALVVIFTTYLTLQSGRALDHLDEGQVTTKLNYFAHWLVDRIGAGGVIAVGCVLLLLCGLWGYREAQNPPAMRYLNPRE